LLAALSQFDDGRHPLSDLAAAIAAEGCWGKFLPFKKGRAQGEKTDARLHPRSQWQKCDKNNAHGIQSPAEGKSGLSMPQFGFNAYFRAFPEIGPFDTVA